MYYPTSCYVPKPELTDAALVEPVRSHVRRCDELRTELEQHGGNSESLNQIAIALQTPISIAGRFRDYKLPLTEPARLQSVIQQESNWRVHLEIRQRDSMLPVYYLCRLDVDYFLRYRLILEDYWVSPGFPMVDRRFVRLMEQGREKYYLRLSPFREDTARIVPQDNRMERTIDTVLYNVGRFVLQAAWHEDQRLALYVAEHFQLPLFQQAIELLYLCLDSQLCELRNALTPSMQRFFETVYRQPAIAGMLRGLRDLDGGSLNDISQSALDEYRELTKTFSQFLNAPVVWKNEASAPLHSLILSNLFRLEMVTSEVKEQSAVCDARLMLEAAAQRTISRLLPSTEVFQPR